MGESHEARCLECGCQFIASEGGGFFFHLLHCEQCGEERSIGFDELGELHLRYLKSLPNRHCVVSREHDAYVRVHVPVEPISSEEYRGRVEALAGSCSCGGSFTFAAPPRCPECRSTRFDEGPTSICYD